MPNLLTVTGGRIELEPNRCYILGRTPDCDIVVEDMASSRRHARITVGGMSNSITIEDLGSRNGTYVNEERIFAPRPLDYGSRVRIGATVYLLAHAKSDAGAGDEELDTATVALERFSFGESVGEEILQVLKNQGSHATTDFAGQLGSFGFIEILQLLTQTNRSGTLHLAVQSGHAKIEIRDGAVLAASYAELEGFQALVMLARQKKGMFWLVEQSTPCRRTIHEPISRLLLELCRTLDEAG